MSRRDTYHPIVKQALIREGWTITHDPFRFLKADPELAADLGAERTISADRGREKIVVEIKSFLDDSQIVELEKALGQYHIYEQLLQRYDPERTLYLAVPIHAYRDIFQRQVGRMILDVFRLRLLVYSLDEQEELLWKTP